VNPQSGHIAVAPRQTRLLRAPDLATFRAALVTLITHGSPLDARDRVVIVPTRAAAEQLTRAVEYGELREARRTGAAVLLPDFITPAELIDRLGARLSPGAPMLTAAERHTLMGLACRDAMPDHPPPFRVRPGIVAEALDFYDALRRHQKTVDAFERLALGRLEPGADLDRGAARLVEQTRFLVAAFRAFEQRVAAAGGDAHQLRARLLIDESARGFRHLIVAVGDQAFDPYGLCLADWDLIARLPGLARIDVVTTNESLAGAPHERMHLLLPGIEEVHLAQTPTTVPTLVVPDDARRFHTARDREDEIAGCAAWIKPAARDGRVDLERTALVVSQPLPYMYLAQEVFRSAAVPCQMFDALPLAAEPYAAVVDLVCAAVTTGFARDACLALLRSPWFAGEGRDAAELAALDRHLAEAGYLGDLTELERLVERWRTAPTPGGPLRSAIAAGTTLLSWCRALAPLREAAPVAGHLDALLRFLDAHAADAFSADDGRERQLRARRAVHGVLVLLRDAFARFDAEPVEFEDVVALIRRSIEERTFAPRAGEHGIHVIDAESARFGEFDVAQLTGLVEGEWPGRSKRSVFYGPEILRELGWPSEVERRDAARARFVDLLRLPASRLRVSAFSLEADAIVSVSPLLSALDDAGLETTIEGGAPIQVFEHQALAVEPIALEGIAPGAAEWAKHREALARRLPRVPGQIDGYAAPSYSLSALERYQDCGFKFFAANVLRLEERTEDQSSLTPRRRGQMLHEILQRFFAAWDAAGEGSLSPETFARAQSVFASVAEPILAALPENEAMLERTRLFGSPISMGVADVVLASEIARTEPVAERWLEYRLEGEFSLGAHDGVRVPLRGVADRIDLLPGRRLRVIDYKSGAVPSVARALQAPIYALCAQERLSVRDGEPWAVDEASYVALAGRRPVIAVVHATDSDDDRTTALADARARLFTAVAGIRSGAFAPRPYDTAICRSCAFSTVCRKDYVADE
jgi:RecB family exonuclease